MSIVIVVAVIVTCCLSIIGASFIILSFLLVSEFRQSPSRRLLFLLSLSDLVVAITYLLRTGHTVHSDDPTGDKLCQAQSAINIFANQASFFWTDFIGLFLFLSRKYGVKFASKFVPMFHMISWGWPAISVWGVMWYHAWGPDDGDATADWCWIGSHPTGLFKNINVWHLWAGKLVEWTSCVFITIMYGFVFYDIRKKVEQSPATQLLIKNRTGGTAWKNTEKKLLAIPFIFIILRAAGTVRTIYYWVNKEPLQWLAVAQAIGDSGQGFANGVLFGLFTDKVRAFYYKLISHCTRDKSATSEGVNYNFAEDSYSVRYPPVIC